MKKKIVATLLLVAMVISMGLMAGCNKSETSGPQGNFVIPEGGYDGSEVTVKFYHTMGKNLNDVLDAYIVEFNKLYPNIHIKSEKVGGYDDVRDQISKEITVKNQPNIAYCYPDHVALYNMAQAVVTLDSLIDSKVEVKRADGSKEVLGLTDAQKADFIPGYYEEGKQFGDNLMYTLPFSKSTEVLYYNKTFFDEHNLKVPTTWDEMEKVCREIKKLEPNSIPLGVDSEGNWFITMCEQMKSPYTSATGDHYLFDNEVNHGFVKRFRQWHQDGLLTTKTIFGGYTSGLFTNQDPTKPTSYMSIGSTGGATHQRAPKNDKGESAFEVDIAPIPQHDLKNPKAISQGPSICIFQKENPQEVIASWLFTKFLTTSPEFQAEFSTVSGYMPVLQSVTEIPAFADFLKNADGNENITALSVKVAFSLKDSYYTSPAFNGSSTARSQVEFLFTHCLAEKKEFGGDVDKIIDAAFKNAIQECEYNG